MHDSGGGGGGGGTNWYAIDVSVMWQWVNRDLKPHYDQSTSWKKTSELSGLYKQRLQAFRDRLAQSWNPDTSKAAEAFLARIDDLIKAVKDVDEVTGRNYQAAVDIPNAISEARYKLKPIHEQWLQSETPEAARDNQIAAASVMYSLSSDLNNARTGIGAPRPYRAPADRTDDGTDYGDGGLPPPMIPPVIPTPPPPAMPTVPTGPTSPMPGPKGPDLSGLTPPPPPPTGGPYPTHPGQPGPHIPPPGNPGPTGPLPPPVIKPPAPGPGMPGPIGPGRPGIPRPGGPIITGPAVPPPTGRGPTGGVIGGQQPAAGRGAGGLRTNPVGGMIGGATTGRGGAAAGRGPAGAGVAGRPGATGAMGVGGRPGQRDNHDGEHFDPDTEWDVAEGVAPVLDAPEKQGPVDPGPAIGLSR